MHFRSQSAMEYLMTYGWAILIVAIVLVALFQLGVLGGTSFGPKAAAGACQVIRTVQGVNLEGECINVIPQYVAQLNGQSSFASVSAPGNSLSSIDNGAWSMSAWMEMFSIPGNHYPCIVVANGDGICYTNYTSAQIGILEQSNVVLGGGKLAFNQWYFIVVTRSGSTYHVYVDGKDASQAFYNGAWALNGKYYIGKGYANEIFNGLISNVQIYNTSLDANTIQSLYTEGIGGAPISPAYVVGWWPLNGNAQDYSGNNNNGAAVGGVSYSSSWTSGYTTP